VKEQEISSELAELQSEKDGLMAAWKGEKEMIEKCRRKRSSRITPV